MTDKLIVLGSTGSVGMQALDVARHLKIKVTGISGGSNIDALEDQIREFKPAYCAVADDKRASELRVRVADTDTKIIDGKYSASELASFDCADTVLDSISGIAGLRPALSAVQTGKKLALANKESLVAFGETLICEAEKHNSMILPVDSEHSAIYQCLLGNRSRDVKKILLTASGGPFFGMDKDQLRNITPEMALAHPTWKMGKRITIDSATLMNKGFEVIEAVRLFGVRPDQVQVVVHRESIIHSMVEYTDNAVIAQLSAPDMRLCAQYALTYPDRFESPVKELDLFDVGSLTFKKPDTDAFPLLKLAFDAVYMGGTVPAAMNAADEEAVRLFIDRKIGFYDISEMVKDVTIKAKGKDIIPFPSLSDIEEADANARRLVIELAASF